MPRSYSSSILFPQGIDAHVVHELMAALAQIAQAPPLSVNISTTHGEISETAVDRAFQQVDADEGITGLSASFDGGDVTITVECRMSPGFTDEDQITVESASRDLTEGAAAAVRRAVEQAEARKASDESVTAFDDGLALLQPITTREYQGVEAVLSVLWSGIENQALSETQRAQIEAMARLIAQSHRDIEPGKSPRWYSIGTVRGALNYLAKELPRDALAWWKLAEILTGMNWQNLAERLPGM